jgi:hypothetical protein
MKQELTRHLAEATLTLTKGAGIGTSAWGLLEYWNFINTNAAGIGVLLTFFFGLVALGLNLYNTSKSGLSSQNKDDLNEQKDKLDSHIKHTKKELTDVKVGIDEILDKLAG